MGAHARFVRLDRLSHVTLTVYSVALLGFSVFEPHLAQTKLGPLSTEIATVLSLSILCASLVVWGLNFGATARDHRDCYLALQKLYEGPQSENEKQAAYNELLEKFPNHANLDYERFLFRKLIIEGEKISTKTGGKKMPLQFICVYGLHEFIVLAIKVLVVFTPAIIIFLIHAYL